MFACIFLTVFVNLPPPMPGGQVHHEWHHYQFCEAGKELRDVGAGMEPSACVIAANEYLFSLQMAGILPGAKEAIQYKATCEAHI